MKKFFTSVAVALASFSFANAQVPSKISYQGVTTKKNQTVQVEFTVCQNNNPVYTEIQSVKTNANGLFATKIGEATGWDAIAWEDGNISVLASVDGILASAAEVTAVPYAKVAQSYVGQDYIEQDVADLVMANRENKTDIAEMKQNYANHLENLDMIAEPTYKRVFGWEGETEEENVVGLVDEVAALQEGLAVVEEAMPTLTTLPVQVTAIQNILNGVEANEEEGIEAQDGLIDQVAQVTNLAQSLSDDLYKEDGLVDAVVALQELGLPSVVENLEMLVPQIEALHEGVDANAEALAIVSSDLQEMQGLPNTVTAIQNMLTGAEEGELSLVQKAEAAYENAMDANDKIYNEEYGIAAQLEQIEYFINGEDSEFAAVSSLATQNSKTIGEIQGQLEQVAYFMTGEDSEFASVSSLATQNSKTIGEIQGQLEQVAYFMTGEDGEFAGVSSLATQNSKNITDLQTENETLKAQVADLQEQLNERSDALNRMSNEFGNLLNLLIQKKALTEEEVDGLSAGGIEPFN